MTSRWRFSASVAVLGFECIACFLAGSIEWAERAGMVNVDSAEVTEQARFATELYAIGALNLLAFLPFLLRRSGWGWWLAIGMQPAIFVLALIEGLLTDMGWFFFSLIPLLTFVLLLGFRMAQLQAKPPVRQSS